MNAIERVLEIILGREIDLGNVTDFYARLKENKMEVY